MLARLRARLPRAPLVISIRVRRGRITREEWLGYAVEALRPLLGDVGAAFPRRIRVSVGFGGNTGRYERTVGGVCFAREASHDRVNQIFISPLHSDGWRVLMILLHELMHACDDCRSGHRGYFARVHKEIGFVGRCTEGEPGVRLDRELERILQKLEADHGPYPHAELRN